MLVSAAVPEDGMVPDCAASKLVLMPCTSTDPELVTRLGLTELALSIAVTSLALTA